MSNLASPRLLNLWQIIYQRRHMANWLSLSLILKHLTFRQAARQDSNNQFPPSPILRQCTQSRVKPTGYANKNISIRDLWNSDAKNILTFKEDVSTSFTPPTKIRIFREHDLNLALNCAGRMVISGRMKDVCAEIDRLTNVFD